MESLIYRLFLLINDKTLKTLKQEGQKEPRSQTQVSKEAKEKKIKNLPLSKDPIAEDLLREVEKAYLENLPGFSH